MEAVAALRQATRLGFSTRGGSVKTYVMTQGFLAQAMGVPRKHVNELCNDRRSITAPTALILARVFGNSADFWLNVQRRTDLWETMNSPEERVRIARARSLKAAA